MACHQDLAYWQILNGELLDAKDNILKAYKEATAVKDDDYDNSIYLVVDSIIENKNLKEN